MTYHEIVKMALLAIPYVAPYVQKWTEKMVEDFAKDTYDYAKKLLAKDPKKLQLIEDAKNQQLTEDKTTEFQEVVVEIVEAQEKAILQKYVPENMTYNDFKKLIETEPTLSVAFDALDILKPKMGADKAFYETIKRDFLADRTGFFTESIRDRLKVFAKKFLA
jgi:hypothetical protein